MTALLKLHVFYCIYTQERVLHLNMSVFVQYMLLFSFYTPTHNMYTVTKQCNGCIYTTVDSTLSELYSSLFHTVFRSAMVQKVRMRQV